MLDALNITEAEAAGLAELAQLDLAMARDFAARAQAAADPETANQLARSYQRAARSYRQTLALKVRLQREIARGADEARKAERPPSLVPHLQHERRAEELCRAVHRVIWAEHERPEPPETPDEDLFGRYLEFFEQSFERLSRDPDFAVQPLDDQVAEACRDLGLRPGLAAGWRELPDPPPEAYIDWDEGGEDEPPQRESG